VARDYYGLLGVGRGASDSEIKRAYRKLARELHPDVNPDEAAQARFKEISVAYEVLSDPEKRRIVDLGGDPLENIAAAGNGFGGFVSVELAVQHGGLFDRLVLVDTGAAIPPQGKGVFHAMAERVESGGMQAVLATALQRMFPDDFLAAHQAIAEERKASLRAARPEDFAAACRALAQFDRRAELGTIRNPTLVVVGLRDTATPPALSYELATGIPGAALVELPQCGHSPHIQDPEGFWQAIKPFLQLAG